MAARLAPGNVRQMHQSLHHIVADAAWSDAALLQEVRRQVLPAMTQRHGLAAWIVDDTGFPKKGSPSVGATRQYCGQLGKQENCRVAVSVSLPPRRPVFLRLTSCIYPKSGPTMRNDVGKPACRKKSGSRPSLRLHWHRSVRW